MVTSRTRIPALDGLRGLAIILVLLGHLRLPVMGSSAQVGVTLFFVLSGYLITNILTGQADSGGIGLFAFYRRRLRRLVPALLVMVAVASILTPDGWWGRAWPALLYVGNWPLMTGRVDMGNLAHVWSLAVEEHFYLVWPLIIGVVPARWRLRTVALLAVGFGIWRLGLSAASWSRVYYGTDTNAFALLTGCVLAVGHLPRLSRFAGAAALAGLGVISWLPLTAGYLFIAVPLAAVAVQAATGPFPALEWTWLRWFGTVSYGVYLWHVPIFEAFPERWRPVLLPAAVVAGWLSWILIERPVLNWKRRPAAPAPVPALV